MMMTFDATLPSGWTISARLMACYTFEDGSTIEYSNDAGYRIHNANDIPIAVGDDYSPSILSSGWRDVLGGLVGFLCHDAEGYYRYQMSNDSRGDGYCFSDTVAEWAYMHDDELSMLVMELEDGSDD